MRRRAVPAAVVDEYHLERHAQRLERRDDRPMHGLDALLFVVERHDDGELGAGCQKSGLLRPAALDFFM